MHDAQQQVPSDRLLPRSPDAERAVLASMLIDRKAFYYAVGTLDADDFIEDAHRLIFSTAQLIAEQQPQIDFAKLPDELASRPELRDIGGAACLRSLMDRTVDVRNLERYVGIVKETAHLRRLTRAEMSTIPDHRRPIATHTFAASVSASVRLRK